MGELLVPDYEPQAPQPLSKAGAAAGTPGSDLAGMTPAKPTVTVLGSRRVSATQFKAGVVVADSSGPLVLGLLTAGWLAHGLAAAAPPPLPPDRTTYLALGDSITWGCGTDQALGGVVALAVGETVILLTSPLHRH